MYVKLDVLLKLQPRAAYMFISNLGFNSQFDIM